MDLNLDRPISEPAHRPRPRCPLCNGALVEVMLGSVPKPETRNLKPETQYAGCLNCAILSAEPYAEWHDFGEQRENA